MSAMLLGTMAPPLAPVAVSAASMLAALRAPPAK
jgi:hypothetical protein